MDIDALTELLVKYRVKLDELNRGRKNVQDLYREVSTRDVRLEVQSYEEKDWICRFALNARCVVHSNLGYLCEVARRYGNNGEFVHTWKPYGLSETQKRGEAVRQTIKWGFDEEYEHPVDWKKLSISDSTDEFEPPRRSTVYQGLLSSVSSRFCLYERDEPIWDHRRPVTDGNDLIYVQWIRFEQLTITQQKELLFTIAKCSPTGGIQERLLEASIALSRRQSC